MKEKYFYPVYKIHLINGEVLEHVEEYGAPEVELDLIGWFESAADNDLVAVSDRNYGKCCIPKKSITFIVPSYEALRLYYKNKSKGSENESKNENNQ